MKLNRRLLTLSIFLMIFIVGCISDSKIYEAKDMEIVDLQDGDEFTITADVVSKTINGVELELYAYNGMIPGVAIRAEKGSTVKINFENNLPEESTIHWHGLRHDIKNDGVPGISQDPVMPGDEHTYELTFPDSGIFWYHPHVREDRQQDLGLAGVMIVPGDAPKVDREELMVLDDILLTQSGMIPHGEENANFAIMGRYGNTMLVNGDTKYSLRVGVNEVVRLHLVNVANVRPYNFSIPGANMILVGSDLGLYEKETFVDSVIISPAERYTIDVWFNESGTFDIKNINPLRDWTLASIIVENSKRFGENIREPVQRVVVDDRIRESLNKEVDYNLSLDIDLFMMMGGMDHGMMEMPCHRMPDGSMMGDCEDGDAHDSEKIEWEDTMQMMNSMSDTSSLLWKITDGNSSNMNLNMSAKVGDLVKIRLFNDPESDHPMQHPIHLHGQRFVVSHTNGVLNNNLVWKDTTLVGIGDTVDILVDVTNPGEWMMHCHIAEHLEAGMMTSLTVEE